MPPVTSVGMLLFRPNSNGLDVVLVHPGGPYWTKKDDGWWSVPKGELGEGEDPLEGALRECEEEVGVSPAPPYLALTPVVQSRQKIVIAFASEGDYDPTPVESTTFEIEWPPRSGVMRTFPEVDRAEWFDLETARRKILPGQAPLLDELERHFEARAP